MMKNKTEGLTVLNPDPARKGNLIVRCDCGHEQSIPRDDIYAGSGTVCIECGRRIPGLRRVWLAMLKRAENGIPIDSGWSTNFEHFRTWAEEQGYTPGNRIEMRDREQGFFPENCFLRTPGQKPKAVRQERQRLDLVGRTFGLLTVVEEGRLTPHNAHWMCRCTCGNDIDCTEEELLNGLVTHCGCKLSEIRSRQSSEYWGNQENKTRVTLMTTIRRISHNCNNPDNRQYGNYGALGYRVCDEWDQNPESFVSWALENDYAIGKKLRIKEDERVYSPENCFWVAQRRRVSGT